MLQDNGKGQTILLYNSLLCRIHEHSLHIFSRSAMPVQLFACTILSYLRIKKIKTSFKLTVKYCKFN